MNKEELIRKLQMVYAGEKIALDDLVIYYDGLQEIIKIVRKENKELQDSIKNKDYLLKAQGKELKELYTENEQLTDNWNKLKEHIVNKYTEFEKEKLDYFYGCRVTLVGIRNKIQELESGDSNE